MARDTGTIVSGAGHAAFILWVVLGDWLFARDKAPTVQVAEVSLMTSAEFDAMAAAVPSAPDPAPVVEPAPAPEPPPEVTPPEPVDVPPPPEPTTEPEPVPEPEPLPENNGVADAELLPVVPDAPPPVDLAPTASPRPKPAPRVAPTPVDAPDPTVQTAEAPQDAVTPDPMPEPQVAPQPEQPPVAQEEAGTILETEANREEEVTASGAPRTSPRPRGRPATRPAVETPPADDIADAIAGAVAEAAAQPDTPPTLNSGATNAPQGPPMTSGERDAMRVAVQQCWNVGSLSSDALNTTVVVAVSVAESGIPDAGSIRMVESSGGSDAGARGAFEAARRAIIRCGARGFPLPPEKYEQWRELELVFNPDGMRLR